jgi:hypothetical protein
MPRLTTYQVAIEFTRAVMEDGDAARWTLDPGVVEAGIEMMSDEGAYAGPWTYTLLEDCVRSHTVEICDVAVGRPGLADDSSDHVSVTRVIVTFAEVPSGVDPVELSDHPELAVVLDEPRVSGVEGIAG